MSKPSITNCPNTFFRKVHSFSCWLSIESGGTVVLYCQIQFACVQIRHTPLSGGYCGEVPPLPIPNREVKLTCADGTAMQCGRVGSRLLLSRASDFERFLRLFSFSHRFPRCTQILDLYGLGWRRFFAAHKNMEKHLVKAKIALSYYLSVKILLKYELFLWIIWWVQIFVVLLHSLLRNHFSKQLKKEFFERFYINRQVVQEAVNFLEMRKLTG